MATGNRPARDEPVSLAPLTPEEALRALLAVKPDDEPVDAKEVPREGGSPPATGAAT